MPYHPNPTNTQIEIIEEAMKKAGVWSIEIPVWIKAYQENHMMDIWQWLQYIYLPMRHKGAITEPHYIAPLLSPFVTNEPKYQEILRSMIELDAISSTTQHSNTSTNPYV